MIKNVFLWDDSNRGSYLEIYLKLERVDLEK